MKLVVAVLLLLSCRVCGVKAQNATQNWKPRTGIPLQTLTPCQQARANTPNIAGAYRPQCDTQGQYTPQQCWASTGYTWCVNTNGQQLPGTLTPNGALNHPKCTVKNVAPCQQANADCPHLIGSCCPTCDNQGQYTPLQCCGSTGYCRCVTTSGKDIPGTLTPPGHPLPKCTKTDLTPCEQAGENCTGIGGCKPTCDNKGQYTPLQCCASTGYCWCVNSLGHQTQNSLTLPGRPHPNCH